MAALDPIHCVKVHFSREVNAVAMALKGLRWRRDGATKYRLRRRIMEELVLQDKPGLFSRLGKMFVREDADVDDVEVVESSKALTLQRAHRYLITVRRGITTFDDAMEAAHGLKRGEQQILNLSSTDPTLRQKIVDFMSGVNFAQEGTWEEIGEHTYVVAPATAFVEVAPAASRITPSVALR